MPLGTYDLELVVDGSGTATAPVQAAHILHNFAVKCPDLATYQFEFTDGDGYGVYASDEPRVGPNAEPINRNCKNFIFSLYAASPGTYLIRVMAD